MAQNIKLDRSLIEAAIAGKRPDDHRKLWLAVDAYLQAIHTSVTSLSATVSKISPSSTAVAGATSGVTGSKTSTPTGIPAAGSSSSSSSSGSGSTGSTGSTGGGGVTVNGKTPVDCSEVGTPLEFYPGALPTVQVMPESEWVDVELQDGKKASFSHGTLVSCYVKAEDLEQVNKLLGELLVSRGGGKVSPLKRAKKSKRKSWKQSVREPVHQRYLANGIEVHNLKAQFTRE